MPKKVIITGGAGFIGSNAAHRYLERGYEVVIIDSLCRVGTPANLQWVEESGPVEFLKTDIRDARSIDKIFREHRDAAIVLHFAGQVAVTTSVADPRLDFETNALGTLNVLEAMRAAKMDAVLIYSSTNKVYGELDDVEVVEASDRYEFANLIDGVSEQRSVDFHSPYGCSKGAADQYVRDYHRIYGLNTVVFRQSCIFGTHQFGVENQGWIAWFLIAAELGLPLTVYGNGKQVRDGLYVDDLLDSFDAAVRNIDRAKGQVYNIGGGPENALALLDLIGHISSQQQREISYRLAPWRPGDQRIYVSDIRRAGRELGWRPRIKWQDGVDRLSAWVRANRDLCRTMVIAANGANEITSA
jgi:CDP-paratose 2-epimerase